MLVLIVFLVSVREIFFSVGFLVMFFVSEVYGVSEFLVKIFVLVIKIEVGEELEIFIIGVI